MAYAQIIFSINVSKNSSNILSKTALNIANSTSLMLTAVSKLSKSKILKC